jgi:hypothetical protein
MRFSSDHNSRVPSHSNTVSRIGAQIWEGTKPKIYGKLIVSFEGPVQI